MHLVLLIAAALQPGQIVDKVECAAKPEQSYALYLPSRYTADHAWPILYAFDPAARGRIPVERFQAAAEKYGYIVVGSHNSRNGPWKVSDDALKAMWADTHERFNLDARRIYSTGFSGGARVATAMAMAVPDVAGVIACGAGFPGSQVPKKVPFAFFGIAGNEDFNYTELRQVRKDLEAQGSVNRFEEFDGPHSWCPAPLCTEAIEWMELMAMKSGRRPVDQELVDTLFDRAFSLLHHLESGGNVPGLYRGYARVARDFQGLKDVSDFAQRAAAMKDSKEVRDALKQERQGDEREVLLIGQLQNGDTAGIVSDLRKKAGSSENTPQRRMARRVLTWYERMHRDENQRRQ